MIQNQRIVRKYDFYTKLSFFIFFEKIVLLPNTISIRRAQIKELHFKLIVMTKKQKRVAADGDDPYNKEQRT